MDGIIYKGSVINRVSPGVLASGIKPRRIDLVLAQIVIVVDFYWGNGGLRSRWAI
jgi:hypothetical protein